MVSSQIARGRAAFLAPEGNNGKLSFLLVLKKFESVSR
jgi:hypothetical protein